MTTIAHTEGPWNFLEQGEANEFCLVTAADLRWVLALRQNGEFMPEHQLANMRRIVTCVNACEGMADPANEIAALRSALATVAGKIGSYHDAKSSDAKAHIVADIEDTLAGVSRP